MSHVSKQPYIHVVAGAVRDNEKVLIAQRPPGKHLAGGWEFPGGKLHAGEAALVGLQRELKEELSIDVVDAQWLCECTHDYPERRVRLELWVVNQFEGLPLSNEGQQLRWENINTLHAMDMLPADQPLISALQQYHVAQLKQK